MSNRRDGMDQGKVTSRNPSRLVHCLICGKPQTKIEQHLRTTCLRDVEDGRLQEEVSRAKESQEKWAREGRTMDFVQVRKLVREDPSCDTLADYFRAQGFFLKLEHDSAATQETELLALAEEHMGEVSDRLRRHQVVPAKSKTEYRTFCIATLMWVHHLGPTSICDFKVQEWNDRVTEGDSVLVKLSKGSVMLSLKEEHWLDCYCAHIRSEYLLAQPPEGDDRDRFFLGAGGVPLRNPTSDTQRFRQKYITRLQERAPPETESQDKQVANPPSTSDKEEERASPPTAVPQLPAPRFWCAFVDIFPVTLHGNPPSKEIAAGSGFQDRSYYHYWRRNQHRQRVQYILEQSTDRTGQCPSASHVQRALDRENTWITNRPTVESVLLAWAPCQELYPVADDPLVITAVVLQNWKGLSLKHYEGKGKGVITTMNFKMNQVVCDYHGVIVSKQEGERRLETLADGPSYLFFFKGKGGEPLCIDAQNFPCICHPEQDTYGRRINHSRKENNVRPVRMKMHFADGQRECVLFLALRDIGVGEELLWDYGVRRSSFHGEGRDIAWLDD